MEALSAFWHNYGWAFSLIALACFSLIASIRKIPRVEKSAFFKAFLPILSFVLGGVLGAALPWVFPKNDHLFLRMVIGAVAGSNASMFVSFGRRLIRYMVTKKLEGKADIQAVFAPVDENGTTIPPDTMVGTEHKDFPKNQRL